MFGTWFKNPYRMACAMMLFCSTVLASEDAAIADRLAAYNQHYPAISYSSLRRAMDAGEVFIIDANRAETYTKGHLPGAQSLAERTTLENRLPILKKHPIVVYCGGPQCTAWYSAADFAAARGYTSIMHYKGGLKNWKEQGETLATGNH